MKIVGFFFLNLLAIGCSGIVGYDSSPCPSVLQNFKDPFTKKIYGKIQIEHPFKNYHPGDIEIIHLRVELTSTEEYPSKEVYVKNNFTIILFYKFSLFLYSFSFIPNTNSCIFHPLLNHYFSPLFLQKKKGIINETK